MLRSTEEAARFWTESVRCISVLTLLECGHLQSSHPPNLSLLSTERKDTFKI